MPRWRATATAASAFETLWLPGIGRVQPSITGADAIGLALVAAACSYQTGRFRVLVETAMAMVDVIRADEMSRLSVCADESCEGIVLDLSRNRSRRYCSTACTNRNAVAAYRARRAQG